MWDLNLYQRHRRPDAAIAPLDFRLAVLVGNIFVIDLPARRHLPKHTMHERTGF
jgi:hypothetical protein